MKIRIFTDGACSSLDNIGGWSAVFNMEDNCKTISGYQFETTNNRMELMGVLKALEKVRDKNKEKLIYGEVDIHSDSSYVVNAFNDGWIGKWKLNNWMTSSKEKVKNQDLWESLIDVVSEMKNVKLKFIKVKGHSGNTFNEIADAAARKEVMNGRSDKLRSNQKQ